MAGLNDVCREKKNHPIPVSIYYVLATASDAFSLLSYLILIINQKACTVTFSISQRMKLKHGERSLPAHFHFGFLES